MSAELLIEADGDGCAICMRPELVRVEHRRVGFVRGWRYLRDEDAPPDLVGAPAAGDEPPPEMAAELRELGLNLRRRKRCREVRKHR